MATPYEVEHGIKASQAPRRRRQIDMSTFMAQLHQISDDPSATGATQRNNPHALPTPVEMAAAARLLQDQFATLAQDAPNADNRELLETLFQNLEAAVHNPPKQVEGVSQEFLDQLERVPKSKLKDDSCPICAERFMDDEYPLVVQLQCHHSHRYDLHCVGPWLSLQGTCPMCRTDLKRYDPRRKDASDRIKKLLEDPKALEDEEDDNFLYG